MARYVAPSYSTETVFAAAAAAQRVNGAYLKTDEIKYLDTGDIEIVRTANKTLVHKFLRGDFDISDEDRLVGEKVRQYCHSLSFKILSGKTMNDFELSMLKIAEKETVSSNYDIAVIASLPASYERSLARREQDARIRDASGCIEASVGSKVEFDVEVVRCNYSNNWETYFVTAITESGVVFFAHKNKIDVDSKIRIKGKVKRHKEDRTQLSHVKVF